MKNVSESEGSEVYSQVDVSYSFDMENQKK